VLRKLAFQKLFKTLDSVFRCLLVKKAGLFRIRLQFSLIGCVVGCICDLGYSGALTMARNLSARERWMAEQIATAFKVPVSTAADLVASEEAHARVVSFLTKADSPSRLFVYNQPLDVRDPVRNSYVSSAA
jgi:hypothetical protein